MSLDGKNKPVISIIMGVYRPESEQMLRHAVQSLLHQSFTDWELFLCDDGSPLPSAKWIRNCAGMDPRIRLLTNQKNQGLSNALNRCLSAVSGAFIARMDADDIAVKDRLKIQLHFLQQHPEYGFVSSNVYLFDQHGVWGMRQMPQRPGCRDFLCYSPYVHPALLMRREVYQLCGGYREGELTLRCEDYDLFFRIAAMGIQGYNLPEKLIYYREDRKGRKIPFIYRWRELLVRQTGLAALGFSKPVCFLASLRPLAAGLIPRQVRAAVKKTTDKRKNSKQGKPNRRGKNSRQGKLNRK